jgi:hypothetical protein
MNAELARRLRIGAAEAESRLYYSARDLMLEAASLLDGDMMMVQKKHILDITTSMRSVGHENCAELIERNLLDVEGKHG